MPYVFALHGQKQPSETLRHASFGGGDMMADLTTISTAGVAVTAVAETTKVAAKVSKVDSRRPISTRTGERCSTKKETLTA